jgi:hypothetical protein
VVDTGDESRRQRPRGDRAGRGGHRVGERQPAGDVRVRAGVVIWVVGTQKIAPNRDAAFERIYEYSLPREDERAREAYGIGSRVNKVLVVTASSCRAASPSSWSGSSWALRRWAGHRPAGSRAARGGGHGVAAAQGRRNQRPATSPAAGKDRLPTTPATVEAFMAGRTCRGVPHHQVLPGGGRPGGRGRAQPQAARPASGAGKRRTVARRDRWSRKQRRTTR